MLELQLQPLALRAKDAAQICGLSLSTWWSMDAAGTIPRKLRCGKRCLWRVSDLKLWISWGMVSREEFESRKGLDSNTKIDNGAKPL